MFYGCNDFHFALIELPRHHNTIHVLLLSCKTSVPVWVLIHVSTSPNVISLLLQLNSICPVLSLCIHLLPECISGPLPPLCFCQPQPAPFFYLFLQSLFPPATPSHFISASDGGHSLWHVVHSPRSSKDLPFLFIVSVY